MMSRLSRIAGLVALVAVGVACSSKDEAPGAATRSSVTQRAFDRNDVLDDTSMRDVDGMTVEDVQRFLEKTPWGTTSVLATFEEGGKSAAQIMTEAAQKHGINPLEMIVRLQMEQGLVRKTTAAADTLKYAFGCGCPHAPVCETSPEKYTGFANQAECAAGTLGRSMERALTTTGTVSGWARNRSKASEDGVSITPKNAATAALYTYTPWVGEAGGGKQGVGGVSLHYAVWATFAEHAGYGEWAAPRGADAGADDTTEEPDPETPAADAGAPDAAPKKDAGPTGDGPQHPPEDGRDDGAILQDGNSPPANNSAPPPRSKPTKGYTPEQLPNASDAELADKKKTTAGGCSTSGSSSSSGALVGLAVAAALVMTRRRRDA